MEYNFDWDYFDNPTSKSGYQGYYYDYTGEGEQLPWKAVVRYIKNNLCSGSVLDIGCAKGYLVFEAEQIGLKAFGYDISTYAIQHAISRNCIVKDICHGIHKKFDVIVALGTLIYIEENKIDKVLKNIFDYAGNYFVFSAYFQGGKQNVKDKQRKITKTKLWWIRKIMKAGFRLYEEKEWGIVFYTVKENRTDV